MREADDVADILVVDDTPVNLKLLSSVLEGHGYRIRAAPSGELALRAAAHRTPDLVLLDVSMPSMDGYAVCRALKQIEASKDVPVLFISAHSDPLDKVKAFAAGAVDYVTKPFLGEEVRARVATHLALRKAHLRVEEQNSELRETQVLRDNLFHMIVHDMRSPISGLLMGLDMLKHDLEGKLAGESQQDLDLLLGAAQDLLRMSDSLLDVSRLEAGDFPLDRKPHELSVLVAQAIAGLGPLARGHLLQASAESGDVVLSCDADLMRRVLQNLLHNAIKHSPKGTPITVSHRTDRGHVRIEVRDQGTGIAPEHLPRIFDKFVQVSEQRASHSSGLGLAFCRMAIEAHGGRIGAASDLQWGTMLWIEIPSEQR